MAPGGLDRLTGRAALDACLADIAAEHNRGPVAVEVVDYATFNGLPAVVVRFTDPRGGRWAWASGAGVRCAGVRRGHPLPGAGRVRARSPLVPHRVT